jgi:excisionase family DNA binding protein
MVLTKAELATVLKVSVRTIDGLLAEGRFPIPRLPGLGRKHLWSQAAVDRYLNMKGP